MRIPIDFETFALRSREMDGEAAGIYLLMLAYISIDWSLPSEPKRLCRVLGVNERIFKKQIWPQISHKFIERDGDLFSVDFERDKQKQPSLHSKKRIQRMKQARILGTHTDEEWAALLAFCEYRCVKCGSPDALHKDHIRPVSMGGSDAIENLQPLCQQCNCSKGADDCTDHRKQEWRSVQ